MTKKEVKIVEIKDGKSVIKEVTNKKVGKAKLDRKFNYSQMVNIIKNLSIKKQK